MHKEDEIMKHQTDKKWLWGLLALGALILLFLIGKSWRSGNPEKVPDPTVPSGPQASAPSSIPAGTKEPSVPTESTVDTEPVPTLNAGISEEYGLSITSIGSYTGAFVEDGTNEIVSGVAMVVLENLGEEAIQYGELALVGENRTLHFSFSTLPPGSRVVLLELQRQAYLEGEALTPQLQNLACFDAPLSCQEDLLEIQALDGILNIHNISGQDIPGEITLYYKNQAQDLLYGGITFRVRIQGGLKSGEIRQITAQHFDSSSRIMFVTIG